MKTKNYNYEQLQQFCLENKIVLLEDYNNIKFNSKLRIKANCITNDCNNQVDKQYRQLYVSGCYCKECTLSNGRNKMKETCLKKYGVSNPMKKQEIKDKNKDTCFKKYGTTCSLQSEKIKEKVKETCLEKYGVEYSLQSQEVKQKIKETCLKKYGVDNIMKNITIR